MITTIDYPLSLNTLCASSACRFDPAMDTGQCQRELGIVLPESMASAVGKRRAEFLAGRLCARQALTQANGPGDSPITRGENREPKWPDGFIGSITHSSGFAAAAVANREQVRAIGIDSEKVINPKTARNVSSQILQPGEGFEDAALPGTVFEEHVTLIFSAKESLFKCLYPLVNRYFGFDDARISLLKNRPDVFLFELLADLSNEFQAGYRGRGQFVKQGNFYHTAIVLPASDN